MIAHNSDYRLVCRVSHTSCYAESFVFTSLMANGSSEWTVCRISHTPWSGCPFLLFCLIANSSYRSTVCPSSHTQLKSEPCLMYLSSQMFCIFFDGFLHHRLWLIHRTQFRQRVSNHSVALAASCSSGDLIRDSEQPSVTTIMTQILISSPNVKCVDRAGSRTIQTWPRHLYGQ